MNISVLGCGRWGAFLAWYLGRMEQHNVLLYGRERSWRMAQLRETRKNDLLDLPARVTLTRDIHKAVDNSEILLISIGVQSFRGFLRELSCCNLSGKKLVLCMKGLEAETGLRLTEIVRQELGAIPCAVWVGPGHVQDFLRGIPNCMVIDSADAALQDELIRAFSSELIRFYYGGDLTGNEVGAAAKNVIGIAAGLLDGCELTSLKGALMARGTREISRLIEAMGGDPRSAYGLAHLGDYEATVFSPHSHNRAFGEALARGESYTQLAEGAATAQALCRLSDRLNVELPICRAVCAVIYDHADPRQAIFTLFDRALKREI